ncbi:hypothetical protein [Caballeronia sp. GAWG1-1]|uniref:hypothetical protein n=1 Tax=Caballeronia sp. GAWG1-1 TaxID=2921742 RepID=UPI0032ED4625
MEQWVRVQNERDRLVLAWLRSQVGDAAILARNALRDAGRETVLVRDLPALATDAATICPSCRSQCRDQRAVSRRHLPDPSRPEQPARQLIAASF